MHWDGNIHFPSLKSHLKRRKHALPSLPWWRKEQTSCFSASASVCKLPQQNQEENKEEIGRKMICRLYQESVQCLVAESCGLQMPTSIRLNTNTVGYARKQPKCIIFFRPKYFEGGWSEDADLGSPLLFFLALTTVFVLQYTWTCEYKYSYMYIQIYRITECLGWKRP